MSTQDKGKQRAQSEHDSDGSASDREQSNRKRKADGQSQSQGDALMGEEQDWTPEEKAKRERETRAGYRKLQAQVEGEIACSNPFQQDRKRYELVLIRYDPASTQLAAPRRPSQPSPAGLQPTPLNPSTSEIAS